MNLRQAATSTPGRVASGLLLIALILVAAFAYSKRQVDVVFTAHGDTSGRLQVFHDAKGGFSEAGSRWLQLGNGKTVEEIQQVSGRDATQLRFDPPLAGVTTLCGLRIGRSGLPGQYEILHAEGIKLARDKDCLKLQPDPDAQDPKLVVRFVGGTLDAMQHARTWQNVFHAVLSAFLLGLCGMYGFHRTALREWLSAVRLPASFKLLDANAHWMCAALMLVFGVAYVLVTPPGAVADEEAHLAKIIRVSEGFPFGGSGLARLPDTREMYGPFWGYAENKAAFSSEQLNAQLGKKLACAATSSNLPRGANSYFLHQYLLPSLAFRASCASGASFGVFLYSARLLNLLLSIALVFFALRHAVRGKWALFAVALLPMSLFQMGSLSADSLAIGLSIAWLGLISGIAGYKVHLGRGLLVLWVLSLAIALLKPGAAWILVCLVFCKPAFDKAGYSFGAAMLKFVALPWVIHAAWTLLATQSAGAFPGVDAVANAHSLRSDPLVFVHAWSNTFLSDRVWSQARMLIGVLGWLDVRLSPWAYSAGGMALLATLWSNEDAAPRLPRWVSPLALAFAVGSIVMIALPLFIYWSPLDLGFIQGLQGRYFIITVAFALVWCSFRTSPPIRALLVSAIIILMVLINLDALQALYRAYFVVGRI